MVAAQINDNDVEDINEKGVVEGVTIIETPLMFDEEVNEEDKVDDGEYECEAG